MALALGLSACFKQGEDPNAQLNAEIKLIDSYLTAYAIDDVLYDNETGLRFQMNYPGNDAPPHSGQNVKISYSAKILTAEGLSLAPFDAGLIDDNLDDVNPQGLAYAISVLLEGASARVYIPSKYCYGETGRTGVPPNTPVVYDLTLEEVTRTTAQINQIKLDTAAIHTYIKDFVPTAEIHENQLFWYTNDEAGSGSYATPYSIVTFDYTLKLLTGTGPGTVVQQNTMTNSGVFGLIDGLKLGFPKLRAGDKAVFYIPSTLAYGTSTQQAGIPANSNLVFEIKLTSIAQ